MAGAGISGVKHTIAIASGKGGVGKSTVAANLAVALAKTGAKVGLLDADIYGPSIPLMFGLSGAKPLARQIDGKAVMVPQEAEGIKLISIGFLVDPNQAVVWRGPMASGALKQFVTDVDWGELDYLLFDMPPGTGDIQLTLTQAVQLTGAVIVTTPQDVALADARKGVRMFEKVQVPVLGIIENMSYYECPKCGNREEIFSHGGARKEATEVGVPFLGELPLQTSVRIGGDNGKTIVSTGPETLAGKAFTAIAKTLIEEIASGKFRGANAPVQISL